MPRSNFFVKDDAYLTFQINQGVIFVLLRLIIFEGESIFTLLS